MCYSMENLQTRSYQKVVRFKDFVIECVYNYNGGGYKYRIHQPVETEKETGLSFIELRLELVTESDQAYPTDGEAIFEAMKTL